MPSRRESPQAADLSALLEALCAADIEFIVVGGLSKVNVLNLETILDLKRDSRDPKDRERLPVYEETLKLIRDKK